MMLSASAMMRSTTSSIVRLLGRRRLGDAAGIQQPLQIAHQRLTERAGAMAAEVTQAVQGQTKAERDARMVRNIVAAIALSSRPVPVAARLPGGQFAFMSAVGGADTEVQLRPSTHRAELSMVRDALASLTSVTFPLVADGESVESNEILPLSSFLVPYEEVRDLLGELRRLHATADVALVVGEDELGKGPRVRW